MPGENTPRRSPAPQTRRIAWDHVSLTVPGNWELAAYHFPGGVVTRIELEDEYAVRLEAEWTRPRRKRNVNRLMRRYQQQTQSLAARAHERSALEGLPPGWSATRCAFRPTEADARDGGLSVTHRELVTAFFVDPNRQLVAFLLLYFLPDDPERPEDIVRMVAGGLEYLGEGELVRWQVYDLSFEVPRDFVLENTLFDIGAKMFLFGWRLRRFYLWHFSCADAFLKDGEPVEKWFTGHLNAFRHIRGVVFAPGEDGTVLWRRRFPHLLTNREELARWCFRYRIRCRHDTEHNRVVAWLFSYRRESDLNVIPPCLRFAPRLAPA